MSDASSAYAWRGYVCLVCGHLCVPSLPGTLGRYLDFPHIPHRTSVGTHYVLTLNKSSTYGAMSSTALCKFLPKTQVVYTMSAVLGPTTPIRREGDE